MKVKSMRDIPTVQGLVRARTAPSREQMVNDLVRLSRELAVTTVTPGLSSLRARKACRTSRQQPSSLRRWR